MTRGGRRPGSGRKRLPAEQHKLNGNYRPGKHGPLPADPVDSGDPFDLVDEALVNLDVDPDDCDTDPPAHLTGPARQLWRHIAPWLISEYPGSKGLRLELLTRVCELMQTAEAAAATIRTSGTTYMSTSGMIRARPEVAIQREAIAEVRNCLRELELI